MLSRKLETFVPNIWYKIAYLTIGAGFVFQIALWVVIRGWIEVFPELYTIYQITGAFWLIQFAAWAIKGVYVEKVKNRQRIHHVVSGENAF